MQKIISLFKRDYEGNRQVIDEGVEGAEWVIAGEGVATRKWDGTSCLIKDGRLYKRYDAKHGKNPPDGFVPAQDPDPITGHWPGWLPVRDGKEDQWHREAFNRYESGLRGADWGDGTYELVGPKINGNKDNFSGHMLVKHGLLEIAGVPRTYSELKVWIADKNIEGIVWHHPDGRMVKIKKKDFGYKW